MRAYKRRHARPSLAVAKLVASFSGSTATRGSYRPEMQDGFGGRRECSREDEKEYGCREGRIADEPAMKALIIGPDMDDLAQGWRKANARYRQSLTGRVRRPCLFLRRFNEGTFPCV